MIFSLVPPRADSHVPPELGGTHTCRVPEVSILSTHFFLISLSSFTHHGNHPQLSYPTFTLLYSPAYKLILLVANSPSTPATTGSQAVHSPEATLPSFSQWWWHRETPSPLSCVDAAIRNLYISFICAMEFMPFYFLKGSPPFISSSALLWCLIPMRTK